MHTHTHTHTQWGWKFPKQNLPLQCAWLSGKSPCSCFYVQTNAALGSSVGSVTFWVDVCSLKTAVWFGVSADFLPTPAGTPEHASLHTSCLCMEHLEPRGGTGRTETSRGGTLGWAIDLELCALSSESGGLSETVSVKSEQPRGARMLGPRAHQPGTWDVVLSQGPWSLRCLCGGVGEGVRASSCRTRCAAWVSSSLLPSTPSSSGPSWGVAMCVEASVQFRAPPSPSWVTGLNLGFGPRVSTCSGFV